jgi:hypothetical protein
MTTIACVISVISAVCQSVERKTLSFRIRRKLPRPTHLPPSEPAVREREVDGEDERNADERSDQQDRGRDQERGEDTSPLCDVPEPPSAAPSCRHRCRHLW